MLAARFTSFTYRTPDGRVCQADMADLQRKATKTVSIPYYSESDWNISPSELTCVEPRQGPVGAAKP